MFVCERTDLGAVNVDYADQLVFLEDGHSNDGARACEIKDRHIHIGDTVVGEAVQRRIPIQIPDIQNDPNPAVFDVIVRAGFRALLIVPLLGADRTVGALVVRRKQPGEFWSRNARPAAQLRLMGHFSVGNGIGP